MESKKKITILYEKNKNASSFPVSGAYGGITPDHEGIIAHFYIEYPSVPHSTVISVDLGHEENVKRGDITREIQSTVYLSPETAITIGNWLVKNGKDAKKKQNKENE